jgi:hypothetical protein
MMVPRSPWCRRRGDAVAGDTEPGAQPGELSGDGAVQRQHVGCVQRGDDVAGPVTDEGAQAGIGGRRPCGVGLRDGRDSGENPGGDDVALDWEL